MVNRDEEARELLALAAGGHSARLVAARRYGKTTLLRRVLEEAEHEAGMATALVDLEGVLTMGSIVVRIERAYDARLQGKSRKVAEALLRAWNLGISLGAASFAMTLQANPRMDTESALLRLLDLPVELHRKTGQRSLIVFDEIQDVLRVDGADGVIRSRIQHQRRAASYAFAGSAPGLMSELFDDPSRPLLEQAVPMELTPLNGADLGHYIEERFQRTGRDTREALSPLIEFVRGHPQRSMLLAHHLWRITPRGEAADEAAWLRARDEALRLTAPALEAHWSALPVNEQRVTMALAVSGSSPRSADVRARVGLKRGSVEKALAGLAARADITERGASTRLTDPLFEAWLRERGAL